MPYHRNPSPCNLEKQKTTRALCSSSGSSVQCMLYICYCLFPRLSLVVVRRCRRSPVAFLVLGNARFDFLPSVRLFVHPFAAVHFCLLALYNCWASNCCFSTPWKTTTVCCVYSSSSSTDLLNKFTGTTTKRLRYKCLHMGWSIHCMWLITTPPFVSPP